MKLVLIVFLCLYVSVSAKAQIAGQEDEIEQTVEEITLARDDGEGGAGEEQEAFLTSDVPIHCSVLLTSAKPVVVKMNIVFIKAGASKSESKVVTVSFKTNGKQNRVNFTGSPERTWTAGTYRVDILLDGKLTKSKVFEVTSAMAKKP